MIGNGVNINKVKVNTLVELMSEEAVMTGARAYRTKIQAEILQSGRFRTGQMISNIDVRLLPATTLESARAVVVPQEEQFRFQNDGTRGATAKPGKVLRFLPKGSSIFVFARRVKGVKAGEFLNKAARRMSPDDFV